MLRQVFVKLVVFVSSAAQGMIPSKKLNPRGAIGIANDWQPFGGAKEVVSVNNGRIVVLAKGTLGSGSMLACCPLSHLGQS